VDARDKRGHDERSLTQDLPFPHPGYALRRMALGPIASHRYNDIVLTSLDTKGGRAMLRILLGCLLLGGAMAMPAAAENAPGVTDTEIKIGQTMPYTGPGAWLSSLGLAEKAYMQMINDQGGINGRKINLISVDDGFMPWRTGNETRKLIEVQHVAFTFGSIGTPTQLEVAKYLNDRKIPQLFIESGAYRWGNTRRRPTRSVPCARATDWQRVFTPDTFSGRIQIQKSASSMRIPTSVVTIRPACATCWATNTPRPSGKRPTSSRILRLTGRSSNSSRPAAMR
jgi:Periplasmic binding protein